MSCAHHVYNIIDLWFVAPLLHCNHCLPVDLFSTCIMHLFPLNYHVCTGNVSTEQETIGATVRIVSVQYKTEVMTFISVHVSSSSLNKKTSSYEVRPHTGENRRTVAVNTSLTIYSLM